MRNVVIPRAGGYEQLTFETRPEPSPAPEEVVVTTEAIGVNYADCVIRMGLYASAKEYVGWPITPGFEFAGTVPAAGRHLPSRSGWPAPRAAPALRLRRFGGGGARQKEPRRPTSAPRGEKPSTGWSRGRTEATGEARAAVGPGSDCVVSS